MKLKKNLKKEKEIQVNYVSSGNMIFNGSVFKKFLYANFVSINILSAEV